VRVIRGIKGFIYDLGELGKPSHVEILDMLSIVCPKKDELILDAGGGTGRFSLPIADLASLVVNVDICTQFLHWCKDKASKKSIELIRADIANLPLRNEVFDKIICFDTLHHVQTDRKLALAELYRCLKPDGFVLFRDTLRGEKGHLIYRLIDLTDFFYVRDMRVPGKKYKREYWTREEYLNKLREAGFSVVKIEKEVKIALGGTMHFIIAKKLRALLSNNLDFFS